MKRLLICTIMMMLFLSTSAAFAVGFDPLYVAVERVAGCGATTSPPLTWYVNSFNVSSYYGSRTHYVSGGFPRTDIDTVRVKVRCVLCQFYDHDGWNWRWYDQVQDYWRQSNDWEGYYSNSNGTYYYRAEERYSICNDDYEDSNDNIMIVYWNDGYPNDKYWALFQYPVIIE